MGDTITQEIIQVVELDPEIIQVVEIADRGLTGPAGLPVDILATAPASPTEGYTYYNTTDNKLWFWNGTAWVDVTDAETFDGQDSPYYLNRDNHTGPSASKATPVDADNAVLLDSAASGIAKKLSWANIKATLKAYFDTLYAPIAGAGAVWGAITGTLSSQTDLQAALDAKVNNTGDTMTGGLLLQNQPGEYWTDLLKLKTQGYGMQTTFQQGNGLVLAVGGDTLYLQNNARAVSSITFRLNYTDQAPFTPRIEVISQGANDVLYRAKAHGLQAVNLFEFADSSDVLMSAITKNGSFMPPQIADASAANNTLYFSTDVSKLSYKDPGGTVNRLY